MVLITAEEKVGQWDIAKKPLLQGVSYNIGDNGYPAGVPTTNLKLE